MTSDTSAADLLAKYIGSLARFVIHTDIGGNYGHLCATLADAILQANNNYERNVRPRIDRIRMRHAGETSLENLKALLLRISIADFLDWRGDRRAQPFRDLMALLDQEAVDTEADLRQWLLREDSDRKLLQIRFIGPKTANYLKILVGLPVAAIDRRLRKFLHEFDHARRTDAQAQDLIH